MQKREWQANVLSMSLASVLRDFFLAGDLDWIPASDAKTGSSSEQNDNSICNSLVVDGSDRVGLASAVADAPESGQTGTHAVSQCQSVSQWISESNTCGLKK